MRLLKRHNKTEKQTEREKIEARREEVLARGRKFKYPLQYAKHKIVALTIVISALALLAANGVVYLLLFKFQSTGDLIYRISQVIPYTVAKVDGTNVRYSDYLLLYKSSITPIEKQGMSNGNEDFSEMKKYYKREALTTAENYTYAIKLANELKLTVSNDEINQAVALHRKAGGVDRSEEAFSRILRDNFDVSLDEYRRIIYLSLLSQKVSESIDELAKIVSNEVQGYLDEGKTLSEISTLMGDKVIYEETGGFVDRMNIDGGRSTMALTLEKGKTSRRFVSNSGNGYYFIALIDKTESSVNYVSLHIPFSELKTRIEKIRKEGKVTEKITLEQKQDNSVQLDKTNTTDKTLKPKAQ